MSGVISSTAATASSTPATSTPVPQAAPGPQPGASQFGQFRLTTFVDSNPNPMKTTAAGKRKSMSGNPSATQSPVVRPSSVPVGAAVRAPTGFEKMGGKDGVTNNVNGDTNTTTTCTASTANGSGNNNENQSPTTFTAPIAVHRRTASSAPKMPQGQHNGFGVLDLTPPLPPHQGKLGQHRDGRVRNPVPRKLKGKTDMRNGNFSVMHMDMSAHTSHDGGGVGGGLMLSRGEQAQRTSENTAKAARVAALDKEAGKGGVKRRRVDGEGGWEPILSQASQVAIQPAGGLGGGVMVQMPKEIVHRTEGLTREEVKYEQARLLTLLRSLNPLAVVDQMCTALAFFGGIPGAPPPADGLNFPESEDANGSGSLFVGWLSEIFPDPQRRQWSSTKVQERAESVMQGKRPRGRPKGSKATKVRKDKGIKKGRKDGLPSNASIPGAEDGDDPADDDWVDIVQGDNEAGLSGNANAEGGMITDLDGETPSQAAAKRKVGRPRGSKNKDKERDENGNEIPSVDVFTISSPSQQQNHSEGAGNASATFEQQSHIDPQPKRKPGRPPGSKANPKEGAPLPAPKAPKPKLPKEGVKEGPTPTRAKSVLSGDMPAGLAADERAVLEAYRKNKAIVGPATEVSAPGDTANKRKRKSRAKPKATTEDENGEQEQHQGDTPTMLAQQLNSAQAQQTQQPTPTQQTAVPPPPPKRQRKAKESAPPKSATTNSASNSSNIDPSLQSSQPPSASPHIQPPQTQQPQSRPQPQQHQPARSMSAHSATNNNPFASPPMNTMNNTNMGSTINNTIMPIESMMPSNQQGGGRTAQGLEAHYERFANQDSQSQSPNTYTMGGMNQPQQISQAHKQGQRSSPSVAQMMQRTGSQGQGQQRSGAVMRSPQKSATMSSMGSGSSNNMYYGQGQTQQSQQGQQRHVPTQSSGYGYSASTGMGQNQQASRSNTYNLDAFGPAAGGGINRSSMAQLPSSGAAVSQHQRGNSGYGVQSQQNSGYFDGGNIAGTNYVDLPALETGLNSGYGGGLPVSTGGVRSASYGGSAMGGSMGGNMAGGLFGAEGSGISESEIRERLLRGIGRR